MKPPVAGQFKFLTPPRGDESMLDVCADLIADAKAGRNGFDADDLCSACQMCDDHARDVKLYQETQPGAVPSLLSMSLVAVLALYTAELAGLSPYSGCNDALRSADRSKCKPYVKFIWFLMHAMAKCDPYVGGNVYRGVKADLRAQYPNEREVTWFQFSSCTCDIQVEQSEQFCGSTGTRTLFSIELTTGRARVITKFSLVPSEAEVLLPPNSRFKVVSQFDAGNGLVIIQLKELPSRDPIIQFDAPTATAALVALGGSAIMSPPAPAAAADSPTAATLFPSSDLSYLTIVDVAFLFQNIDPNFAKYWEAAKRHNFNGHVLAAASDDDLSELLREMYVSVSDRVRIKAAVQIWRGDPTKALRVLDIERQRTAAAEEERRRRAVEAASEAQRLRDAFAAAQAAEVEHWRAAADEEEERRIAAEARRRRDAEAAAAAAEAERRRAADEKRRLAAEMEADEAAIKIYNDALAALSRAQEALRTAQVACERYDAAARLVKWDSHFIAKHENRCALGGTRHTAVSRAEGRCSNDKGKAVTVDERCRIRPINNMNGRQHCMGIFFSASLQENILAFETATLRDEWVSKLTDSPAAVAAVITAQQRVEFLLPSKHLALLRKEERKVAAKAAAEAERQAAAAAAAEAERQADRDFRERQNWEHDLSRLLNIQHPDIDDFLLRVLFTELPSQLDRAAPSAKVNQRHQHKPPTPIDRTRKCPFLIRCFYSK